MVYIGHNIYANDKAKELMPFFGNTRIGATH